MNKITHTPVPWTAAGWSSRGTPILAADPHKSVGRTIAIVPCDYKSNSDHPTGNEQADYETHTTKANIEFIVRACNCHEELLAALERYVNACGPHDSFDNEFRQDAIAAIAKARKESTP